MNHDFQDFKNSLQIGESLLGVRITDCEGAYEYAERYSGGMVRNFLGYFSDPANIPAGNWERDLIRYLFMKNVEQRIMSDIYTGEDRKSAVDVFYSPYDIGEQFYPTNLPLHLEKLVQGLGKSGEALADRIAEKYEIGSRGSIPEPVLLAAAYLGGAAGYKMAQDQKNYKGYACRLMLTRNEIRGEAGKNLIEWMIGNGWQIEQSSFDPEAGANIAARRKGRRVVVLMSAEIAPTEPSFRQADLYALTQIAKRFRAAPYSASVILGSGDKRHFEDGVLLIGDKVLFQVHAFVEIFEELT